MNIRKTDLDDILNHQEQTLKEFYEVYGDYFEYDSSDIAAFFEIDEDILIESAISIS
jgi:hypothetical protein